VRTFRSAPSLGALGLPLLVSVAWVACGGHPSAPPADLGLTTGVPCGAVRCAPCAGQFCDTASYGVSGECRAQTTPLHQAFGCDGPEDCPSGACCMTADGSACSATGFCIVGAVRGTLMCHVDETCGASSRCCPIRGAPPQSPYRACLDGVTSCP
jgi:hypothetical protein